MKTAPNFKGGKTNVSVKSSTGIFILWLAGDNGPGHYWNLVAIHIKDFFLTSYYFWREDYYVRDVGWKIITKRIDMPLAYHLIFLMTPNWYLGLSGQEGFFKNTNELLYLKALKIWTL